MAYLETLGSTITQSLAAQQAISLVDMGISFAIACVLGLYVLFFYKKMMQFSFYSPNFGKALVGLPMITTAVVFAMQVNVLVSLGMVGALSIVRFRNAVKDPLDLLFLFWSISIGIVCGTSIYTIAIFASVVMTIVLLVVDKLPNRADAYVLVLNCEAALPEADVLACIAPLCKHIAVRTRTRKPTSMDLLIAVHTQQEAALLCAVSDLQGVLRASLVAQDGEVRG